MQVLLKARPLHLSLSRAIALSDYDSQEDSAALEAHNIFVLSSNAGGGQPLFDVRFPKPKPSGGGASFLGANNVTFLDPLDENLSKLETVCKFAKIIVERVASRSSAKVNDVRDGEVDNVQRLAVHVT